MLAINTQYATFLDFFLRKLYICYLISTRVVLFDDSKLSDSYLWVILEYKLDFSEQIDGVEGWQQGE